MSRGKRTKGALGGEAFIAHPISMRESIAWKHLPNNARRILDRLEREHVKHGGRENGALPCTYTNFEEDAGIPPKGIALAIRQCEALGFIEVVHRGQPAISVFKRPSIYRLTYIFNRGGKPEITNEWKLVTTDEQARARLAKARAVRSEVHAERARLAVTGQSRAAA